MKLNNFIRALVIAGLLLVLTFLGSQFLDGWAWTSSDYIFAGLMFFGTALLFEFGRSLSGNTLYRAGFGLALATGFVIIWASLAVGFIGSEDNPVNLIYFAVLAAAFLASISVRFDAQKMGRIMFATALCTALVPVVALMIGSTFNEHPDAVGVAGVFAINMFFTVLFIGSGLLFKQASTPTQA